MRGYVGEDGDIYLDGCGEGGGEGNNNALPCVKVFRGNVGREDVEGMRVFGNIPLHLAATASSVVAVEFEGNPPRGREYGLKEMNQCGAHLVEYKVSSI